MYAPGSLTTAETFIWYSATPDLTVGIAHLWKQNAVRYLASYRLMKETATIPSAHVSMGVQGIGTGNPGFAGTFEKNFAIEAGTLNVFGGLGFRSNEDHAHPVAGIKLALSSQTTFGLQWDGHHHHPFVTQGFGQYVMGLYLINGKSLGYMLGARF